MLLRRFTQHVTDQNWFAVALDFFIVVGGVVVAFQLQSWGEERAAAARADRSLHQLYEESDQALDYWVDEVRRENARLELQDRAIAALFAGDRGELSDDDMVEALAGMGRYSTLAPPRRTYDELSSAGLLREIDAPQAMAAIAEYYETVDFIQGQIAFFRPDGNYADEILNTRMTSVYDDTLIVRQRIELDFDRLAADGEYLQVLISEFRNQTVFQFYRRWVMHDAAQMCLTLAETIGEPCTGFAYYEENSDLPEWQTRNVPNYGNPPEGDDDLNEAEEEE